jgi:hypothetical protein
VVLLKKLSAKMAMNPRLAAAMDELKNMNWEEYFKPQTSKSRKSIDSEGSLKSISDSTLLDKQARDYSGYVFKDVSQESLNLNFQSTGDAIGQSHERAVTSSQPEHGGLNENEAENDDDNEEELSTGSNEPVLDGENNEEEDDLDSPDSLSTKESFNDQEILAHKNAIKNKDILHESFLFENTRQQYQENDQHSGGGSISAREQGGDQGPLQNTSHSIEGDTKSVTFADEDSIYEFDRLDEKSYEESYPDMDPNTVPTFDREEITRRYMVEAVREETHLKKCFGRERAEEQDQDEDRERAELVLNRSSNEELEFQFAKERLEQLLVNSPEFRAAILTFPALSQEEELNPLPSQRRSHMTDQRVRSRNRDRKHAKPFSESSVADSADSRLNLLRPRSALPRLSKSSTTPDLEKKSPPKGKQTLTTDDERETVLMSKTADLNHIYRLAAEGIRQSPSIEFAPPPPKLSTECPMIPFDAIQTLAELNYTGDSPFIALHPSEEKLRLKVKYFVALSDWDASNRMDFFGLHFSRLELMNTAEEPTIPSSIQQQRNWTSSGDEGEPSRRLSTAPMKKKLLFSQDNISDLLFTNRTKDLRRDSPHLYQFNSFIKETYTGFVCLVFDMKMQLLGTYEHQTKEFYPGLTICPPHLPQTLKKKKQRGVSSSTMANLFEIDLNALPMETFAIVPVLSDDCPLGAKFPEMNFQFDLSVTNEGGGSSSPPLSPVHTGSNHSRAYWMASEFDQPSESTPFHDLFDVKREIDQSLLGPPEHVVDLDPGWTHVESYFCTRDTLIDEEDELEGPPELSTEKMVTQSKVLSFLSFHVVCSHTPQVVTLDHRHSFVPFVVFRCLSTPTPDDEPNPNVENLLNTAPGTDQRCWGIKSIQESLAGVMFQSIVRGVLDALKRRHILPFHMINVEHCMKCHLHSMTTWHVPGSYEKWFYDLKRTLRRSLPPAIITSNKFTNTSKTPPRVGSFELSIRPYSSEVTQLIFSKLSSRTLPPTETILQDLAVLLNPETVKFKGSHILELHVLNNYSKQPLKGAVISLYQITVSVSLTDDIERNGLREMRDVEEFDETGDGQQSWTRVRRNRHKIRIENAKRNSLVQQARASSSHRHTSSSMKPKDSTSPHVSMKKKLVTSHDTTDGHLRHSFVYYKVRSWKVEDIAAWFRSFSIGKEVITRAVADGVVDGASFLALANQQSFQKWGVKNKIKLERMNKSLEDLFSPSTDSTIGFDVTLGTHQGDHSSSHHPYDPFTDCLTEGVKVTEIKYCESGKPKPSYNTEDMNLKLISRKQTDSQGLGFIALDTAGSYFFRIESSVTNSYCSAAFRISSSGHTGYCAAMTPRIGTAHLTIKLDDHSIGHSAGFRSAPTGILVSMMNLMSGKRHIAFAKQTSEKVIQEPTVPAPTPVIPVTRTAPKPPPPKRSRTVDGVKASSSISPGPSPRPGGGGRQNSVGSVLLSEMTQSWRGGPALGSNKQLQQIPSIVEVETRVLEAVIWLPVGKYYSEVTGEVFEINEVASASETSYWDPKEAVVSTDSEAPMSNQSTLLSYSLSQAQRCHRRILLGSIRAFQKIYRRYKKDFLTNNLWAYLALKRHLRRYLEYIRGVIRQRRATAIAAAYRRHAARQMFHQTMSCLIFIQCVCRRYLAKLRSGIMKRARLVLIQVLTRYLIKRRQLRQVKACHIQCLYRRHLAILRRNKRLVHRRIYRALRRWLKRNIRLRAHLKELRREQIARETMEELEASQREYLRLAEAEEKRKIREKIQRVERKRNGMAMIIQRNVRSQQEQRRYLALRRGVTKLQVCLSTFSCLFPLPGFRKSVEFTFTKRE